MAVDEERADLTRVAARVILELDHQVVPALADPDRRHLLADERDSNRVDDVAGRQPHPRRRLPIDDDLKLRQPGHALRTQVGEAFHSFHDLLRFVAEARERVEIGTEDADGKVGWRSA